MKEDEQATGGYIINGKPYILGEEPDYWAGPLPKGMKIEIELPDNIAEEEISAMIRKAIRGELGMLEGGHD